MSDEKLIHDMRTVEGSFQEYLNTVFKGIPIGPLQVHELRKAYFGAVLWHKISVENNARNLNPRQFHEWATAIHTEVLEYSKSLTANQPGETQEEVAQSSPIILPPNIH